MRNTDTFIIFKRKLNSDIISTGRYFSAGNRCGQLLHTRLRTKCSSLNDDLFQKRIDDSPLCLCGNVENTDHYFSHCRFYHAQRSELIHEISQHTQGTLQILLFGNPLMYLATNALVFEALHKYITDTKCF